MLALAACVGLPPEAPSGNSASGVALTSPSGTSTETAAASTLDPSMDEGSGPPPDAGILTGCDPFTQDCPQGFKCTPWAPDGGATWNSTRCSPVDDMPGMVGDSCTVEGSATSGIDTCGVGLMCWDVDPVIEIGRCIALCTGSEAEPTCQDAGASCYEIAGVFMCPSLCHPLLQDCSAGEACYPVDSEFVCAPDVSGDMGAFGDPCRFINACDAGAVCIGGAQVPGCLGDTGCCTPLCDASDPACPGGTTCTNWYVEGEAPPGYEDVGVCVII